MNTHTQNCNATNCQKQIPLNLLMCGAHWAMVPLPLRRALLASWRAVSRKRRDPALVLAYRAAAAAAVAAVEVKQQRKIAAKEAATHLFS